MARVMGAADLVVSKAGAMTCAEALALGRPLLLHRSLPGQEAANEACLVAAGAALRARNGRELQRHLNALLGGPELRAALAAAARRLRSPDAGRTVAKEMLGLVGRG
jgi:processive 1,2-diacylglycerol beta-glucosyltransferase